MNGHNGLVVGIDLYFEADETGTDQPGAVYHLDLFLPSPEHGLEVLRLLLHQRVLPVG